MHEPQFVGTAVRLTHLQVLAIGLAALLVLGGVAGFIRYLHLRKGVNELASLLVLFVIAVLVALLSGRP
jgi:hypothetical protein